MADSPLANLKEVGSITEIPLVRQLAVMVALALAIAAGIVMFNWFQQPAYTALYSNLSDKDSAELADAMRSAGIPYRLDASGSVMVPGDKVSEARMHAAAAGLPKGAAMGFEMIQQDQGFGTSQFMENARYQLALETELARTISSLQAVKNARVQLALPKPSPFTQSAVATSASVFVELQAGRELEPGQVESIQHVVASSVPNLTPGNVTVIDQFGRLLSGQNSDDAIAQSTEHYKYARNFEADSVHRIEQLLSPMLGPEHISAQVSADFDFSETEEARESYDPKSGTVRSEQTSDDSTRGPGGGAVGIPGATSNQPPAPAAATPPVAATPAGAATNAAAAAAKTTAAGSEAVTSQNHSETRNYEVDRTLSHTREPVGRLKRLSVAVLVDNITVVDGQGKSTTRPLSTAELVKVDALVKQAVGFDTTRGDTVTVQNAPFQAEVVPPVVPEPFWKRAEFRDYTRQGLGAMVVLILIFAVLRPLLRSLMAPRRYELSAREREQAGPIEIPEAPPIPIPPLPMSAAALAAPIYEQRLAAARTVVAEDPKRVAQVVKSWVTEGG